MSTTADVSTSISTLNNPPTGGDPSPMGLPLASQNNPDAPALEPVENVTVAGITDDPLAPGGRLDSLLAASEDEAKSNFETFGTCHKRIKDDLNRYRYPQRFLHDWGYKFDPVFEYILATLRGSDSDADQCYYRAFCRYLEHKDVFDRILDELIPSDLRNAVDQEIAHQAYENGTNPSAAEDLNVYYTRVTTRSRERRRSVGVLTGIQAIDDAVGGALRGLVFLGGGTFVGKTSLALQVLLAALHTDPQLVVVFVSLDMAKDRVYDRLICHESGVGLATLLNGAWSKETSKQVESTTATLRDGICPRLKVIEANYTDVADTDFVKQVVLAARNLLKASNATRLLTIVDYFQLIDIPELAPHDDLDRYRFRLLQQIQAAICTDGDPSGSPMLVVSEVRKGDSGRKSIGIDDLMGSARLSYGPDTVLLLQRPSDSVDNSGDTVPLILKVAKCRDGGKLTDIRLNLEIQTMRFSAASQPTTSRNNVGGSRPIDPMAGSNADDDR